MRVLDISRLVGSWVLVLATTAGVMRVLVIIRLVGIGIWVLVLATNTCLLQRHQTVTTILARGWHPIISTGLVGACRVDLYLCQCLAT
jgi:hypothetical protein